MCKFQQYYQVCFTMLADIIPTHQAAQWLLTHIDRLLDHLGLDRAKGVEEWVYVAVIVAVALLAGWIVRRCILFVAKRFVRLRDSAAGRLMLEQHLLTKCSHVIPPLVVLALLPFAFDTSSPMLRLFRLALYVYTVVVVAMAVCAVLTFVWTRFDEKENTNNLPLKGVLNVGKGIVWIIVAVIVGSLLLGKTPGAFLAGLGAFAAALMLVFKDTILGFVAGIQLSNNDMLHVGDWIVVPSTIANGIVTDVSLTAVKVRNWDNTIVTLPPYTLVSTSFQNWRGMSQSGARQICRSVNFEAYTVKRCDDDLLQRVSAKYPKMKTFIDRAKSAGKVDYDPGTAVVNGTIETNLGLFRAYMCQYLLDHPLIVTDQQILVRLLAPTTTGIPLQIWCFTTTAWTAYEAVQSEIFEHIAAVCGDFDLRLFNYASGMDTETVEMLPADSRS